MKIEYKHAAFGPYATAQLEIRTYEEVNSVPPRLQLTLIKASFIDDNAYKPAESFTVEGASNVEELYLLLKSHFAP